MILTEYVAKCDCCGKREPAEHGQLPDNWSRLSKVRTFETDDLHLCSDCRSLALIMLYTSSIKELVIAASKVRIVEDKKVAVYYDKHRFEPCTSRRFYGPSEETCEYCGKDPRNLIHQENENADENQGSETVRAAAASDVGGTEQAPRDSTEAAGGTQDVHQADPKRDD